MTNQIETNNQDPIHEATDSDYDWNQYSDEDDYELVKVDKDVYENPDTVKTNNNSGIKEVKQEGFGKNNKKKNRNNKKYEKTNENYYKDKNKGNYQNDSLGYKYDQNYKNKEFKKTSKRCGSDSIVNNENTNEWKRGIFCSKNNENNETNEKVKVEIEHKDSVNENDYQNNKYYKSNNYKKYSDAGYSESSYKGKSEKSNFSKYSGKQKNTNFFEERNNNQYYKNKNKNYQKKSGEFYNQETINADQIKNEKKDSFNQNEIRKCISDFNPIVNKFDQKLNKVENSNQITDVNLNGKQFSEVLTNKENKDNFSGKIKDENEPKQTPLKLNSGCFIPKSKEAKLRELTSNKLDNCVNDSSPQKNGKNLNLFP